jgi:hypothetical protein
MQTYEVEINGKIYEVEANSIQEASQTSELMRGVAARAEDQRGNPISALNRGLASTASMAVDAGAALQNAIRSPLGARTIKLPGGTSDSLMREALGRGGVDTRQMPGVLGRGFEYIGAGLPFAGAGPVVGSGGRILGDAASSMLAAGGEEIGRRVTGSELGAGVGNFIGGLTPTGFAGGVRTAIRGGPDLPGKVDGKWKIDGRPGGGTETRARYERFDSQGIEPSIAQVTGNRSYGALESGLSSTFGGTSTAREFGIRQQDRGRNALVNATRGGAMDKNTAGRIIREGVFGDEGYVELTRAKNKVNYDRVWDVADGDNVDLAASTRTMLNDLPADDSLAGLFVAPKLRSVAEVVNQSGPIPVSQLDEARKQIGNLLGSPVIPNDVGLSRRDLKRIYAALSDDIERNLERQSPAALKAFRYARDEFKKTTAYMEGLVNKLAKIDADEKIFGAIEGGRIPDTEVLRQAKEILNESEWNTFVRTFTNRLGDIQASRELPELTFSSESFLTKFNQIKRDAPDALDILYGRGQYRQDIERIATTFEDMRRSRVYTNPSETAGTGIMAASLQSLPMIVGAGVAGGLAGTGSSGVGSIATGLAAVGAGYVGTGAMANLMHNQKLVRWLARSTEIKPQQYAAHIARLRAMGEGEENAFFNELADTITEQLANGN